MGYNENFIEVLLRHSIHNDCLDDAIVEWCYWGERENAPNYCICGHYIEDNHLIRNRITNEILVVGNVCINKFQIERRTRSRQDFLELTFNKASSLYEMDFVLDMIKKMINPKTRKAQKLYMTNNQRRLLERIAGREWPWSCH